MTSYLLFFFTNEIQSLQHRGKNKSMWTAKINLIWSHTMRVFLSANELISRPLYTYTYIYICMFVQREKEKEEEEVEEEEEIYMSGDITFVLS